MSTGTNQPHSIQALRDAFGDSRPPGISRKITACVACRKQKIKCSMESSGPPCTRCRKRGLSCTVNRSLQMLLESDTSWKVSMESEMRNLKNAIGKLANHASMPGLVQSMHEGSLARNHQEGGARQAPTSRNPSQREVILDADSGPEAPPASYLTRPTPTPTPLSATSRHEDIISRGRISPENAQACLHLYRTKLDHFPYQILGDHDERSLSSIRAASPFLLAAICSVGSLHMAPGDFDACYEEFRAMYSSRSFAKDINLDDIRALCIGAFWLSEISWALVGTAVRMSTELQLHKSFDQALRGHRNHYLRARLYLLVYACDHHFSIPYGRPPLTREDETIRNARKFLRCVYASEDDARLVSQVLRWSLCTNVFDTYGTDTDTPLTEPAISQLRKFCISLDGLRAEWSERFIVNPHVGNYPSKGVALQCDFAKLYLCSHAFRGVAASRTIHRSQETALIVDNIAHEGIISALSIINTVTSDTEVQSFFDGLPVYFDVMLAFAVVFLFKISRLSASFRLDLDATKQSVHELIVVLRAITATMHPRHFLVDLTNGIGHLLQRCNAIDESGAFNTSRTPDYQTNESAGRLGPDAESGWFDGLLDPRFTGEYDILMGQEMEFIF
ncbi:hypothetical protein P171DRAFT_426228 [Karstenula rhodostoma CBS 690.94]|uniref:Zn(2)-C6 fungal-type domain-containing protein n=1 Tax=Karstenula rhodostoma CBS 690.94 TaxID=1392251 RepID=A0A9P4UJJ5_9PLEO|nr:hypothetical protein P171DRAFT_426228 [Karstenula rhodostoma CBS 690.94]